MRDITLSLTDITHRWIEPHVRVHHVVSYSPTCQWTPRQIPYVGDNERCHGKHGPLALCTPTSSLGTNIATAGPQISLRMVLQQLSAVSSQGAILQEQRLRKVEVLAEGHAARRGRQLESGSSLLLPQAG